MRSRLLSRTVPALIVAISLVVVGALAIASPGFPIRKLELHDSGVWVTNDLTGTYGRVNKSARGLDGYLEPPGSGGGRQPLDVLQDAAVVVENDPGTGVLVPIDSMAVTNQPDGGVQLLPGSRVDLRGGTAAVIEPGGKVWAIRYDPNVRTVDLRSLDPNNKPLAELGAAPAGLAAAVAIAVGVDGVVHALSANGKSATLVPDGPLFKPAAYAQLPSPLRSAQVAAVGSRAVSFDAEAGTVILPNGSTKTLNPDPAALLQQSGPDAPGVLIGTSTGLVRIGLDDGVAADLWQADGTPAAPVRLGGCDFGAWAGQGGAAVRGCDPNPVQAIQVVAKNQALQRPAFRVNRNSLVLNDSADGRVFDLDAQIRLDNWDVIRPPKNTDPDNDDPKNREQDVRESKPKANDDEVGARPGRTTTAYLLDNDTDSASGILMITKVTGVPDGVGYGIAPDGQTVKLDLPSAQRPFGFGYTISNGYNTSSANVSVRVRAEDQNQPPYLREGYQQPDFSVASLGTLAIPVAADWRDPDGDPVTLVSAEVNSDDPLSITSDGRIEFSPARSDSDVRRRIEYTVTDDGSTSVKGAVRVKVLKSKSLSGAAPIAQPDAVRGEAGQPMTILPLNNDIPGSDPRNPEARLTLGGALPPRAGLKVATDELSGRVTVTAAKAGSYFLDYTATFGSAKVSKSRIRLDVAREKTSTEPVAMPDQAAIRGRGSILIDVLHNDFDPLGGLLTVQEATTSDKQQSAVSIVAGRWLLVTALRESVMPNPQVVRYTVTNGRATATGDAKVTVLKALKRDQALVRHDLVTVRDSDTVLINALSNDASASGRPLTLVSNVDASPVGRLPVRMADPEAKGEVGEAYVHGDRIRYVAPAGVESEQQVVIEYTAQTEDAETAVGQVLVTVKPQPASPEDNRAPAPEPVDVRVTSGDRVSIPLPISGQDPDGDSVTVLALGDAPKLGRVTGLSPAGITYEAYPNADAVGTDTFSVVVADRYGKTGTATVRVAVVDPGQTQPPVSRDDLVIASPNAKVRVDARANDLIARSDQVDVEALDQTNEQLPAGVKLLESGLISLQAPGPDAQPLLLDYALSGNGGSSAPATIRVLSQRGYLNPPVIRDLVAEASGTAATVDLLQGAWDPDGVDQELTATLLMTPPGADVTGSKATIPMLERPQVIPYRVVDPTGASTAAILFVPPRGAGVPFLKVDALIELGQDQSVTETLGDYVLSPRDKPVRFTDASPVVSSPTQVKVERLDNTRFTVTGTDGYSGPAAVTMEVMDGASVTEEGISRGYVTIPIQVGPKTPVLRCPSSVQTVIAGGRARSIDIASLCHVWAPNPADIPKLVFTADWAQSASGVSVTPGHRVTVQASGAAVPQSEGILTIGVQGLPAKPQTLRVRVLEAPPPTMTGRTFTDVKQGTPVRIPLGISSPLLDARPGIVKVEKQDGPNASVDTAGSVLTITPGANVDGSMSFVVTATDVADHSRQDRWVSARFTLVVYGKPGAPGAPQPGARAQSHAENLSWAPAEANGAAITKYEVQTSKGLTQTCQFTSCHITGLDNGVPITFKVRAYNKAGPGEWSKPSRSVTPDQPPPAVTGLRVSNPQDGRLTLSWNPVKVDGTPVKTFHIVYGGHELPAAGTATTATLTGMDNNTRYTISIAAENSYDIGPSTSIQGQSAGKPLGLGTPKISPSDITGANTSVNVSWTAADKNGPSDLTYTLVRSGGKTICSNVSGTSCVDDLVTFDGKTYTYTVTATNGAGGPDHSSSESATWQATGTPGTPAAPRANPTGTDEKIRVQGTIPDSRGAQSTVRIYADGSEIDSFAASPRGDSFDKVLTVRGDGVPYTFTVQVCNETRCGGKSGGSTATAYGPIRGLQAGNGGSSGHKVTLTVTVNPNGRALDVIVNGSQEATTDARDGSWSRSFTYDLGGYDRSRTFNVTVRDASRSASDSITLRSEAQPPDPKTVRVSEGTWIVSSSCSQGCYFVRVDTSGFAGQSYTCQVWDSWGGDHVARTYTMNGNYSGQPGYYFGHWGEQVWAICGGVSSARVTWTR